jgi:hypothetical protein
MNKGALNNSVRIAPKPLELSELSCLWEIMVQRVLIIQHFRLCGKGPFQYPARSNIAQPIITTMQISNDKQNSNFRAKNHLVTNISLFHLGV